MSANDTNSLNLTPGQQKFVEALIANPSVPAAASTCKISKKTAYRWYKEPGVQASLKEARDEILQRSIALVQQASVSAVVCLMRNMKEDAPPAVQVRAAMAILHTAIEVSKMAELEQRLAEIESRLK